MRSTIDYSTNGNGVHKGHINGTNGSSGFDDEIKESKFTRPIQGQVVDVILRMHSDLFEHGRKRAELSRDVEPTEHDLNSLEEHAGAMANEAYREPYDPHKNEEHKLREVEYQSLKSSQPKVALAVGFAEADVAKLEDEMSKAKSNMKPPTNPQVLMLSAVAGLALTIAPTLHDYIFITMKDDVLNWAISLLSAAVYGVFITWGLLDTDDAGGRRTVRNWLGLAGGIGVPVGLGILRVANAIGLAEVLFAGALTIVEIGIVLLLESRAVTLRTAYQEWAAQQAILTDISTRLEAARSHLARSKQKLTEIRDAIDSHIRLVEELSVRNFNIEKIKADAIKAVRDGYFEGLAINRGYLLGVRR
ncbi:MAG: hypothetical protein QOJ02_3789 [Acidobacteriota bacterium]|jgi:hypothetical protein|nr:hypothetical protein [Acidobacteriota bacterium]